MGQSIQFTRFIFNPGIIRIQASLRSNTVSKLSALTLSVACASLP